MTTGYLKTILEKNVLGRNLAQRNLHTEKCLFTANKFFAVKQLFVQYKQIFVSFNKLQFKENWLN